MHHTFKKKSDDFIPTMNDVARYAGVSAMTVSRALKEGTRVSSETRKRVLKAVHDLGYVLDLSAVSLSSKKTGFVGAIIPSINNSNFSETVRGIADSLSGTGLQPLLGYTDYDESKEESLVEAMLQRRPEGIILTESVHTPRTYRMLHNAGIPIIETWEIPKKPIDQVVGFSNTEAMALLVTTLAAKGYTKFGYIGGKTTRDARGSLRKKGFITALKHFGLSANRIVSSGVPPISMAQGEDALTHMLDMWPDTQVLICVSDLLAFGVLTACQKRNISIPNDIAIAGFGDYEISTFSHPGITTVNVNCYDIGRMAAQRLHQAINGQFSEEKITYTDFKVIERESA